MNLLILGASGSIGKQTLDVIRKHKNIFTLTSFSVGERVEVVDELIKEFKNVKHICLKNENDYLSFKDKYKDINFYFGDLGLIKLIEESSFDIAVNALVGFVGLVPSVKILKLNKTLALANKESLVVAGQIINHLLLEGFGQLYPIDSEHVAISKCLGVDNQNVEKILITASGGSFRHLNREQLKEVTKEDALNHPTWKMGNKITIDSASMMNKCFEIIEAYYLFNYSFDDIEVILHDESHVHGGVKYKDGYYRLDISKPDMRDAIEYALFKKQIDYSTYITYNLNQTGEYHFHTFDMKRYPLVKWAKVVIEHQGTYGAVLNASNEVAVNAFLNDEISFLEIEKVVDEMMHRHINTKNPTLEHIVEVDKLIRIETLSYINNLRRNKN